MGYQYFISLVFVISFAFADAGTTQNNSKIFETEGAVITSCGSCAQKPAPIIADELQALTCAADYDAHFCEDFFKAHPESSEKKRKCSSEIQENRSTAVQLGISARDYGLGCLKGFGNNLKDIVMAPINFVLSDNKLTSEEFMRLSFLQTCVTPQCKRELLGPYSYLFKKEEIEGHGSTSKNINCNDLANQNYCYGYSAAVLYRKTLQNLQARLKAGRISDPWLVPWSKQPINVSVQKSLDEILADQLEQYGIRLSCYNTEARTELKCYSFFMIINPVAALSLASKATKVVNVIANSGKSLSRERKLLSQLEKAERLPKKNIPVVDFHKIEADLFNEITTEYKVFGAKMGFSGNIDNPKFPRSADEVNKVVKAFNEMTPDELQIKTTWYSDSSKWGVSNKENVTRWAERGEVPVSDGRLNAHDVIVHAFGHMALPKIVAARSRQNMRLVISFIENPKNRIPEEVKDLIYNALSDHTELTFGVKHIIPHYWNDVIPNENSIYSTIEKGMRLTPMQKANLDEIIKAFAPPLNAAEQKLEVEKIRRRMSIDKVR